MLEVPNRYFPIYEVENLDYTREAIWQVQHSKPSTYSPCTHFQRLRRPETENAR